MFRSCRYLLAHEMNDEQHPSKCVNYHVLKDLSLKELATKHVAIWVSVELSSMNIGDIAGENR